MKNQSVYKRTVIQNRKQMKLAKALLKEVSLWAMSLHEQKLTKAMIDSLGRMSK